MSKEIVVGNASRKIRRRKIKIERPIFAKRRRGLGVQRQIRFENLARVVFAGGMLLGVIGTHDAYAQNPEHNSSKPTANLHVQNSDSDNEPFIGPIQPKEMDPIQMPEIDPVELVPDREHIVSHEIDVAQIQDLFSQEEQRQVDEEIAKAAAAAAKVEAPVVTVQSLGRVSEIPSGTKHVSHYYCNYDGGGVYGDGGTFCNHMANGATVHKGAAACGPDIPFGTVFRIEGYGDVVCEDRGGAISDNDIDVWVENSSEGSSVPQGFIPVVEVR